MVSMDQGNIAGSFGPMHGDVPHFDLQVEGNDVKTTDLGAAAGNALDLSDHPPPDVSLKGFGGGIPESCNQEKHNRTGRDQQILPAAPRPRGRPGHRVCSPSAMELAAPGVLTLLSERS